MLELLPEKHELDLTIKKRTFSFVYFDAKLCDLIELMQMLENKVDINEWFFEFLRKANIKNAIIYRKFRRKDYNKISQKQRRQILDMVLDKWSCGMYGKDEPKTNIKKKGKETFADLTNNHPAPDSALIMRVLEYSNETLDSLLNKTWKQVKYMLEGIMWNVRSESKEGQKANQREAAKKNAMSPEEANAFLKRMSEKRKRAKTNK